MQDPEFWQAFQQNHAEIMRLIKEMQDDEEKSKRELRRAELLNAMACIVSMLACLIVIVWLFLAG